MQLQQLVECATARADKGIVMMQGSEHLVPFLGPLASRVVAQSDVGGPVVRIGAVGLSGVEDALRSAAEGLGQHDILVLAMRAAPDRLPVGAVVDTLVGCGLWVVDVAPAPTRGVGCALVVTLDDTVPWHSYLLGDTISRSERSVRRLLAERAVEGLAERAQVATLRLRDRERTQELGRLRAVLEGREAELVRVTEELRRVRWASGVAQQGGLMMRAARVVRKDPIHGSARVLRSVLRRAGSRGRSGAVSENGDRSV